MQSGLRSVSHRSEQQRQDRTGRVVREKTRETFPSTIAERFPNAMLEMAPAEYGPLQITPIVSIHASHR